MTLKYPFVTEKAMVLLENQSKLQFLVTREASKDDYQARDRESLRPEGQAAFVRL